MAATVVDAFVNMLLSNDSKAAAQKQKMMEELARRKAEAERQHRIEEALRLEAISNRLAATLKLNGLPSLKLKDAGSSGGGLRLKLGATGDENAGIKGLPGIALNDTSGNGGNTPYGIKGLPGIYTNGPGSGPGNSSASSPGLKLKVGDESTAPANIPATALPPGPTDPILPSSLADGIRDPQNMTPQQLADAATLVSSLPPEEQQRLMAAAAARLKVTPNDAGGMTTPATTDLPAVTQLQQVANASQSAASAGTLEDAAAKARIGFDQSGGGLPTPGVALPANVPVITASPQNQGASASGSGTSAVVTSSAQPAHLPSLASSPGVIRAGTPKPDPDKPHVNAATVAACPPGISKSIPSRQELQKELAVRRAQLESLKTTILRLNRTIQLDQQQFAVWEDEATSAVKRLKDRIWDMGTKAALDSFVELQETRYAVKKKANLLTDVDRDQLRKLEHISTLQGFDDYRKWALEDQDDWEKIDGGIRQLIDSLPLKTEPMFYLQCSQHLIDNAYDVTDFIATWDNVQRLDHNSTQFLGAVRQNGERMKTIVQRIQTIEAQLNSTPAQTPNGSPCRETSVSANLR